MLQELLLKSQLPKQNNLGAHMKRIHPSCFGIFPPVSGLVKLKTKHYK